MGGLTSEDILFHGFAAAATVSALFVILLSNPIYSALFLALSMSVLGALFFVLNGYFVSVAQITLYAGAVMVLFIMVLMLFDLKHDGEQVMKFSPMTVAKVLSAALLCGFLVGTGWLALSLPSGNPAAVIAPETKPLDLAKDARGVPPVAQQVAENPDLHEPAPGSPEAAARARDQMSALAAPEMGAPAKAETQNPDEDLTAAEAASLVEKNLAANEAPAAQPKTEAQIADAEFGSTKSLSQRLFTKYVFAFEAVSLLLLVAIVGAVALAKSRGGTHHAA